MFRFLWSLPILVCVLSNGLVADGEGADITSMITSLRERESRHPTLDVSWRVIRDSRRAQLGNPAAASRVFDWRCRSNGQFTRLDGWAPLLSADDTRPDRSFSDPSRSRSEFLAYLQTGFRDPPRQTVFRESSFLIRDAARWPDGWGRLDRLLAAGATFCAKPFSNRFLSIDQEKLSSLPDETAAHLAESGDIPYSVIREDLGANAWREVWLSREVPPRILRLLQFEKGEITQQLDFEYDDGEPEYPSGWTVQIFSPVTRYREFGQARLLGIESPAQFTSKTFSEQSVSSPTTRHLPSASLQERMRWLARAILSWPGLIVMGLLLFLGWKIQRVRRDRRIPDPTNASGEQTHEG